MTGEVKDYLHVQELTVGRQDGTGSSATNPSLAFGDGNTGFFEGGDNSLRITIGGNYDWNLESGVFRGQNSSSAQLMNEVASATNPVFVIKGDVDTGIGRAAEDALSLIAGAQEAMRFQEGAGEVIVNVHANVGLTADTGSSQGDGVLVSSYNVISTCANAGDAVTLPASFAISQIVYIKNDGAQSCDCFPASGDDAGAGANTAVAIAAGDFAVFIATTANSTWTKLMGGTA